MTNREIVDKYMASGLIRDCVEFQFHKMKDKQYKEDFFQDLIVILLTYDNDKMNDADINGHFNALLTRIIQNNIFSTSSPFYRTYYRQSSRELPLNEENNDNDDHFDFDD